MKARTGWPGWAYMAEDYMAKAPEAVREILRRLCGEHGAGPVGEAIASVVTARETVVTIGRLRGKKGARRAAAYDALEAAVLEARKVLAEDLDGWHMIDWLRRGQELIPAVRAGTSVRPRAGQTALGPGRPALRRQFQKLGASKAEADTIVSAIDLEAGRPSVRTVTASVVQRDDDLESMLARLPAENLKAFADTITEIIRESSIPRMPRR